jgi:thioredoxin-dependent peroxiredoxin
VRVAVGDQASEFTLLDQRGQPWSLAEQRGSPVVLYFYPKDDTPGCTKQACDVRDHWLEFTEHGAVVAGISADDVDSHSRFAAKHDLPQALLADPRREAIDAYGVWGQKEFRGKTYEGVIRSSVVIAPDGTVAAAYDGIKPDEQSAKALEVVRSLTAA